MTGIVKFFDAQKGWGYIARPGESDVFVHFSDIVCNSFRTLHEGDEVEFQLEKSEKGLRAEKVVIWNANPKFKIHRTE